MKVLVTGGNSFLAGHIIRELLCRNCQVRTMVRTQTQVPALSGLEVEIIRGNLTVESDLLTAVNNCDAVIHVAADTSQKHRKTSDYFPVNVMATAKLIEMMKVAGCRKLVFVSSANTIGYGSVELPGNEEKIMSGLFIKSGYAKSKDIAEQLVLQAGKNHDLDISIVNPSFMIGPQDFNPNSGKIFSMILGKRVIFYPPGGKNFVDVRDVARGTAQALSMNVKSERYLLTGTNMSYKDFFRLVLTISNQRSMLVPVPAVIIILAGMLGSFLRMTGLTVALSYTNARILCINNYYSNKKAVSEIDYKTRSIQQTLSDYLNWRLALKNGNSKF